MAISQLGGIEMTKKILVLLVAALLIWVPAAEAHTTIIEPLGSHFPYQRWIDESLVPTPEEIVPLIETPQPCGLPETAACTSGPGAPPEIQIAPRQPEGNQRSDFLHEVGHRFEAQYLSEESRLLFLRDIGRPTLQWTIPAGPYPGWELEGGAEWFADTYAVCARVPHPGRPQMGYVVTNRFVGSAQMLKACGLIRHLRIN
jgi:hypothetical protein